ncbi:MAG: HAD-IA family hydrolase [Sphaerochaetaceae bacterium]|nr:HAD-IA family hydrolase [Sphaerochaetaceae bacterium]NLO61349.1 HAD-IA family hydrolase [Spirochaetales bacterium]MDD2406131.1 HAD-IA family hydrolase [Sphaerochaetaceae bacterium]MDD3669957.1 HAD-IA family hydrolase [Sphaerochaetaceae bacterium]MDD4259796.1 HAD-IA family hydrolase [Sphaerochaetaceae bacterium]
MKHTDIAWDFDGTLFDSYPHMFLAFKRALNENGIYDSDDSILSHMLVSVRDAAVFYQNEQIDAPSLMKLYRTYGSPTDFNMVKPFDGMIDLLKKVVDHGMRNHLYTHRGTSSLEYFDYFGLKDLFCEMITAEDNYPLKPDPSALLHIINDNGIESQQLLMVGDRDIDCLAAKNAGAKSCFFNSNKLPVPEFVDYAVDDIEGLKAVLFS